MLLATTATAQTADPCATTTATSDTVTSGRPFTVTWKLPANVPSSTDATVLVPARYDGFLLALDAATGTARTEALPKPTPKICADGMQGYTFTVAVGVAKGSHTMVVSAYMVDAAGARQEAASTVRPFVAVDPLPTLVAPSNVRIWR